MNKPSEWLFPPPSIKAAKEAQSEMASRVIEEDTFSPVKWIGGVDVSNNPYDPSQKIYAAVVVLSYPELEVVDRSFVVQKQAFPYIPGLLGFREVPALIEAFQGLKMKPDLVMVDGHGISHPRRLGIASHLGVLLDLPTIGVAKSILVGKPASELGSAKGSQVSLEWKGDPVGMMLRSKVRSNPLIISVGHRISLKTAVHFVENCLKGYRLPEPTRQAHLAANSERMLFKNL